MTAHTNGKIQPDFLEKMGFDMKQYYVQLPLVLWREFFNNITLSGLEYTKKQFQTRRKAEISMLQSTMMLIVGIDWRGPKLLPVASSSASRSIK